MSIQIQFSAKTFTSSAALLAEAAAVRRRLFNPKVLPRSEALDSTPPEVRVFRRAPRQKLHFHNAHVMAFRRWQMVTANGPCTAHILKRCAEAGMVVEDVTGPSRTKANARFRQMLMWELKTLVQPEISYPAIGRLFGGRNHTTVLHGVKAHSRRVGA